MIEPIINSIEPIVVEELTRANEKSEQFHSHHEAYAVLLEEIEEADIEMKIVNAIRENMWSIIRTDQTKLVSAKVEEMKKHAMYLAAEAIQVAAMCDKYMFMEARKHE